MISPWRSGTTACERASMVRNSSKLRTMTGPSRAVLWLLSARRDVWRATLSGYSQSSVPEGSGFVGRPGGKGMRYMYRPMTRKSFLASGGKAIVGASLAGTLLAGCGGKGGVLEILRTGVLSRAQDRVNTTR